MTTTTPRWTVADFAEIGGVDCPCGTARRAFVETDDVPFTLHVTEISKNARTHYHRQLTETYYILDCGSDARMELDGESIPIKSGQAIVIPPGVRHRAVGEMKVLIVALPKFDPADEWFD